MRLVFEASEEYDNIDWRWSAENGRGLTARGTAVTFWGAAVRARRALRRIGEIEKEKT